MITPGLASYNPIATPLVSILLHCQCEAVLSVPSIINNCRFLYLSRPLSCREGAQKYTIKLLKLCAHSCDVSGSWYQPEWTRRWQIFHFSPFPFNFPLWFRAAYKGRLRRKFLERRGLACRFQLFQRLFRPPYLPFLLDRSNLPWTPQRTTSVRAAVKFSFFIRLYLLSKPNIIYTRLCPRQASHLLEHQKRSWVTFNFVRPTTSTLTQSYIHKILDRLCDTYGNTIFIPYTSSAFFNHQSG